MNIHAFHNEATDDLFKTGVYTIEHKSAPGKYYVGSATTYGRKRMDQNGFWPRWRLHVNALKNNKHSNRKLQYIINKHGVDGIFFSIIDLCDSGICRHIENYWINMLQSCTYGYNLRASVGKLCGCPMTKEVRLKISNSNKTSPRYRRPVYQFSINGEFIKKWDSSVDVEKELSFKQHLIRYCCTGISNKTYNYIWLYNYNEIKDRLLKIKSKNTKHLRFYYKESSVKVMQFDKGNNFIKRFKSISDAKRKTGINLANISQCINNKRKTAGGFIWKKM